MKTTLYALDAKKKLRYWSISNDKNLIMIEYGIVNGQPTYETERVTLGLQGRTVQEQVESRINSRINKKLDAGYVDCVTHAKTKPRTNALGFKKPMLAQPLDKIKDQNFQDVYLQWKYNGHRCLITNQNGIITAYSRNGKPIVSIDHIIADLDIPEGETLDGELYVHGETLQQISSWVRKKQKGSLNLQYYCYDLMCPKQTFAQRHQDLLDIIPTAKNNVLVVPTIYYKELNDEVTDLLKGALEQKYEGLIIRKNDSPYEDGKRSKSLIKVKNWFDAEYTVVDILESVDGHGILVLEHEGKRFKTLAPGTHQEKTDVFQNFTNYLGRDVNVEYAELTKDGIPFHPVAKYWRDDHK